MLKKRKKLYINSFPNSFFNNMIRMARPNFMQNHAVIIKAKAQTVIFLLQTHCDCNLNLKSNLLKIIFK